MSSDNHSKTVFNSGTLTDEEFRRARDLALHIMIELEDRRASLPDSLHALEMVTSMEVHLARKAYGIDPMALIDAMAINARQYILSFDPEDPEDSEDNHQPTPDQP